MGIARFVAAIFIVGILLASPSYAGGFENSGIGTRANGMAGAFRATADDWTAAYYNPAGYAYIWDNQLSANLALVHYRDEITPDYRWGGVYETGIYNDRTNFNAHEILSNPSGGFVLRLPIWDETVWGLSAYQPFDHNVTWTMFSPLPAYNDSINVPADQYRTNLDVVAFQLTVAREFMEEKLSLGLGLQLLRGDLIYTNLFFRENPISSNTDPTYDIIADYPYDRIPQWSSNNGNGFGFGVTAGMLYKVNKKLSVGISASVPSSLTLTGTAQNEFYLPKNNTLWENADSAAIANPGSVGQLFLSGDKIITESDFEAKLDLPASVGIGFAYQLTEKLRVALDAKYTLWSVYKGLEFTYSNTTGLSGPADTATVARTFFTQNISAPVDWENSGTVMLGVEYKFADYLTLFGGGSVDQSPARSATQFTPQFIDNGTKTGINFGLQFHIERWDLGFMSSYTSQPDLSVVGFDGLDDGLVAQRFPGDYKSDRYESALSINYRF